DPLKPTPLNCDGTEMDHLEACTIPYFRTLHRARRISGPVITRRFDSKRAAMVQVEVVILAGVLWRFSPSYIGTEINETHPSFLHIDSVCSEVDEPVLERVNLAVNPGPQSANGWTNSTTDASYRTVTRDSNMARRSAGTSVRSVRT